MPLSGALRSSADMLSLYRGPPFAVAQMWAATPMLVIFDRSSFAPQVSFLQLGLLHLRPTLLASSAFVEIEKSSLLLLISKTLY